MSPRRTLMRHSPSDVAGRDLRIGDWVRVVAVPDSISHSAPETKRAFSRAVGKTFQIEAFDELGCAELDLTGKVGHDTIWLEPSCVRRARRPRKHSRRFRRVLANRRRLDRPRWSFRYVATYRETDDPAKLVRRMQRLWISHGWFVLEARREIHGTFSAQGANVRSRRQLQQWRKELSENDMFSSLRVFGIRLR